MTVVIVFVLFSFIFPKTSGRYMKESIARAASVCDAERGAILQVSLYIYCLVCLLSPLFSPDVPDVCLSRNFFMSPSLSIYQFLNSSLSKFVLLWNYYCSKRAPFFVIKEKRKQKETFCKGLFLLFNFSFYSLHLFLQMYIGQNRFFLNGSRHSFVNLLIWLKIFFIYWRLYNFLQRKCIISLMFYDNLLVTCDRDNFRTLNRKLDPKNDR